MLGPFHILWGTATAAFEVVGTTEDFYTHYRYHRDRKIELAEGHAPNGIFDVVLGSDVAHTLQYRIGDPITVTHGVSAEGFVHHDDKPFRVTGILARTATPVDRSLYVSLYGIEAMHIDWTDGGPPIPGEETPASSLTKEKLKLKQITAFLLQTHSRIDTLRLQREIDTFDGEPLMAIIPGVALGELWNTIGYAEQALTVVSFFVLVVGLLGMLVSLYTSLNERRREMAILRALGAEPRKVIFLLVLESSLLSSAGVALGVAGVYHSAIVSQPIVERRFGLLIPVMPPTSTAYFYLSTVMIAGVLIGFVPAMKAYRNALQDGLSIRV